jgi:hypothetical protein
MSSLDQREEQLLAAARRGFGPSDQDRARVLSAFNAALVAQQSGIAHERPDSAAPGASEAGAIGKLAEAAQRGGWRMLVVSSAVGAVGFASGYYVGASRSAEPVSAAQPGTGPHRQQAAPDHVAPSQSPDPQLPAEPAGEKRTQDQPSPAVGSAHPATLSRPQERPAQSDSLLSLEVSLLRRAEQALRQNNALLALGLLRELDEQVPRGKLTEERHAARVMANCMFELSEPALQAARAFIAQHPGSAYAVRIRSVCEERGEGKDSLTDPKGPGNQ